MNAFIFIAKTISLIVAAFAGFLALAAALGDDSIASGIQLCAARAAPACFFSIF